MSRFARHKRTQGFAAVVVAGLAAFSGCSGSTPDAGSVSLGGKEGKDKFKPGENIAPAADAAAKTPEQFKSIKSPR